MCGKMRSSFGFSLRKFLKPSVVNYEQLCFLRDVDFWGFKISREYLGETLKSQRIPHVHGYKHLKTRAKNRLRVVVPKNLDMARFAACTLTPRVHAVDLPKEYTIDPLPVKQFAGRDPHTGRIAIHHRGGGKKKWFHWVDFNRLGPSEDEDLYEKVLWIGRDLYRSAHFALVANGTLKRYVLAHDGMKVGDVIKSTRIIPDNFEPVKIGDAHPLGALPTGTQVCQIELLPRTGAQKCRAAGSSATIISHMAKDMVLVRLDTRREIVISNKCIAVVGKVYAISDKPEPIGSGSRLRWMGKRPRSGWKQRKTGRFGRKLNKKSKRRTYNPDEDLPPCVTLPPLGGRR